jgi:hypothetical protein
MKKKEIQTGRKSSPSISGSATHARRIGRRIEELMQMTSELMLRKLRKKSVCTLGEVSRFHVTPTIYLLV